MNSQDVQTPAPSNPNKRFIADTSPTANDGHVTGTTKVKDIDVDDLKMLMREVNQEVLEKLTILSVDVEGIKVENSLLKKEIEILKSDKDMDRKRINQLEEQLKSKNLIFKGLNSKSSATAAVSKICFGKLKLPKTAKIIYTKKLFERDGKMAVLAEMDSVESVQNALKNAKNLAGSSIYVEKDLNADRQKDKRVMLQLKKEILAVSNMHKVIVISEKIRVKDKWLRWNKENKLVCGQQEAWKTLKELYVNYEKICLDYNELLEKSMSKN